MVIRPKWIFRKTQKQKLILNQLRKAMNNTKLPSDEKTVNHIESQNLLVSEAKDILRGKKLPPKEILDLAKNLKKYKSFSYARRILGQAGKNVAVNQDKDLKLKIFQQWALCTYKDNDLPIDLRLDEALKILEEVENFETTKNQETLGLIGAIYKRKWEVDNQKMQLERSLLFYLRGYRQGAENDQGYTGINAAFVLDWLAYQEEEEAKKTGEPSTTANDRRSQAEEIRKDIILKVRPLAKKKETEWLSKEWWYYSTLAEAYFGLKKFHKAIKRLQEGKKEIEGSSVEKLEKIPEWEEESTVQQLARLAVFQSDSGAAGKEFEGTPAWQALLEVFGNHPAAVRTAFTGKIGLGLSGGGFRASLFHIGTLARLAELDVLRHVEVLSCVSGGSIIGAHYYLKVRELLQSKYDMKEGEDEVKYITKQDYIKIVDEIVDEFLEGVQRNVRMRIAAEFTTNLKMMFSSKYSRTKRAGELYEEEIFSKVFSRKNEGVNFKPLFLDELKISPIGDTENFNPKLHNWRRAAKIPILVLNATTLNTGHNWQFTTTWMGEPPSSIDTEVDTNDQLRRMYYKEAPKEHQKIRLGYAVSASAGVPGLFEPFALENLYPERIVRLVDGGVCDNQGMASLLEQDCTVILVSDGSGQMTSEKIPSNGLLGVPLRSNSILQARIRDAQYHDLERRRRSSLLRGLMFIHLKEDLDTDPINWNRCLDPIEKKPERLLTNYGIAKDIQECLAAMRTDLDSFSDVEAYSLMTSAYLMTENAFKNKRCVDGFSDNGETVKWKFLEVKGSLKGEGENYDRVRKLLGVSNSLAFKVWRQSPVLKIAAGFLSLFALAAITWLFVSFADTVLVKPITLGGIGMWLLGLLGIAIATYLFGFLVKVVRWRETLTRIAIGFGMCLFGWIAARIHLHIFDKMFLKRGSLDYFKSLKPKNQLPTPDSDLRLK